jgi:FixJ family two-component response regulator
MSTLPGIVYIVDDEEGMRRALTRLLRAANFEIRPFATAREFLAAYRSEEIACVLLDVMMPDIDGMTLQQTLTQLGYHVPIIFLTGKRSFPLTVQAVKSGAVDYLIKPVNDTDLLRAVHSALELAASRRAEESRVIDLRARFGRLTPRERDVMGQVVAGKLNKQIAADLGTGEQNIKTHRGRVMQKMGVQSVADLVRIAERLSSRPSPGV